MANRWTIKVHTMGWEERGEGTETGDDFTIYFDGQPMLYEGENPISLSEVRVAVATLNKLTPWAGTSLERTTEADNG